MMGGFAKNLVVPETQPPAQQLRRGYQKRGAPKQIMKARHDAPGPKRMKQHSRRIGRFIGMKFIEERVAGMNWIDQLREFAPQRFDLVVVKNLKAREITVLMKEF